MLLSIVILVIGLILIGASANYFTNNGAKIAKLLGISPLLIGILIFGFATSAPEMLVSALAAIKTSTDLSIGNALGSNIINISLVLGISTLISPIIVPSGIFKKEWLILIITTIIVWYLLLDNMLGRADGLLLVIMLIVSLLLLIKLGTTSRSDEIAHIKVDNTQTKKIWTYLIISLLVLIIAAKAVVESGVDIARYLGVSEAIIGLTLIAFGTSLPELAVAISSAIKKQHQMIIGNIIGSNLFNTLAVMAMPALIYPNKIDPHFIERDYKIVFGLTLLLFLVAYKLSKQHKINRWGGLGLVFVGIYYIVLLAYGY